jgi:IS5 family transposase
MWRDTVRHLLSSPYCTQIWRNSARRYGTSISFTTGPSAQQQLQPTLEAVRQQAGQTSEAVMTDRGYRSEANLKYLEKKKIEGFIATNRESYRDRQEPGPRGPLPAGATRVDRMRRKLQTKTGAAIYSRRKTIVEPVFGQIKQARGFRQFLLRGLEKVQGEWSVISSMSIGNRIS